MDEVRVSAAIIVRDGTVFCAHRPESLSGPGWEFPGGKVAEGETPEQALRREIREELGAQLSLVWLFDTVTYDYPAFRLVMDGFVCELKPGEYLELTEHDESRWLSRDELLSVDWLPADLELVRELGMAWDQTFAAAHL